MMNFSCRDGKKLMSLLWHQDELLSSKRRWLMGNLTLSISEGGQKKFKRPKFLTDVCLVESNIRNDEVSYENLRTDVEKSFGAFSNSQKNHHVVQDYQQLFATYNMEIYAKNPRYFLENFYSMMNDLSNNALLVVANLVTDKKVMFEKTRPKMKKIIKRYLPKFLEKSNYKDCPRPIDQLSQIFRDPSNIHKKQLTLLTPFSASLLTSIHKALDEFDEMPFQDLIALNRKLRDVTVVPKFPPARFAGKRDVLLARVKKRCQKALLNLKEGTNLPKLFAKALTVVHLSLKYKMRCVDISTVEFYPFSPEVVGLQNDILRALWMLPKVRTRELRVLQPLVDPKGEISRKSFRAALRKYLLECLFECDVVDIPVEVSSILACLNRRSRRRPLLFSTEVIEEEVESVLHFSSQLKRIVDNMLPGDITDEELESSRSDYDSEGNDFDLGENHFCANLDEKEQDSHLNHEEEGIGDSSVASCTRMNAYQRMPEQLNDFIRKEPKLEQDDSTYVTSDKSYKDINSSHNCPEQPFTNLEVDDDNQHSPDGALENRQMRETLIQEICDETSSVAYRLIGYMVDKFLHVEGRNTEEMTRYYLRGGLPAVESPGVGDSINASEVDTGAEVLIRSVEELLLPSVSKSCIEKVKKLMGHPHS